MAVSHGGSEMRFAAWVKFRDTSFVLFCSRPDKNACTGFFLVTSYAFGAAPQDALSPYRRMDYGTALFWTYQVAPGNIAQKGIAVRLDDGPGRVSKGRAWIPSRRGSQLAWGDSPSCERPRSDQLGTVHQASVCAYRGVCSVHQGVVGWSATPASAAEHRGFGESPTASR